jgi:exonuclease VII small subunit
LPVVPVAQSAPDHQDNELQNKDFIYLQGYICGFFQQSHKADKKLSYRMTSLEQKLTEILQVVQRLEHSMDALGHVADNIDRRVRISKRCSKKSDKVTQDILSSSVADDTYMDPVDIIESV